MAELGVGNAIIISLYKPLKEGDDNKISALITYYKKLYSAIGFFIFVLGMLLVPFLPLILNLETNIDNITLYYFLFLLNSVSSYFLIYKTSIVKADQKEYILKKYEMFFLILKLILQIISLVIFGNYVIYLVIQIAISVISNFYQSKKSEKLYPYVNKNVSLSKNEKRKLWTSIKSLFIYQFGNVSLNCTDNLLISIFVGTIIVGFYSNYSMIIASLSTFTSLIFTSIISSLGNFNVDNTEKQKKEMFDLLEMISFWVYGVCSLCLMILLQDFITLWVGKEYLIEFVTVAVIVLNFYISGVMYPTYCFRTTTTLYTKAKYTMLAASVINLILSILLGYFMGLVGILISTAIARLLTNVWYEPYILYRDYFKDNVFKYYLKKLFEIIILIILYFSLNKLNSLYTLSNIYFNFLTKAILSFLIANLFMYLYNKNNKSFKYLKEKLKINI